MLIGDFQEASQEVSSWFVSPVGLIKIHDGRSLGLGASRLETTAGGNQQLPDLYCYNIKTDVNAPEK